MPQRPFPAVLEAAAPRDLRDLMVWPWFSLAKTPRHQPIRLDHATVRLRVEPAGSLGIATVWDADVLIWAVSQIVEALDAGLTPGARLEAPPRQILRFLGRGTGRSDYARLRAAFDRLAATRVETSLRAPLPEPARFTWLDGWETTGNGVCLTVPEWLSAAARERRVLRLDPAYFGLTGGTARWLYRLVRKMGGRQRGGGAIGLRRLHARSGSRVRYVEFVPRIRRIAASGLPGYRLTVERGGGEERLRFVRHPESPCPSTQGCGLAAEELGRSEWEERGTSPCRITGHRPADSALSSCPASEIRPYNFITSLYNRLLAADSPNPAPVDDSSGRPWRRP
ncbi:Replication protein A [Azospirillum sp. RWY-5-1]|uniref:Replication protein A n=1 Tax=Azospirillum oleiclasticum TaxID=2735135 RepID=A0ABX2TCH0_9PROT|nr:replication initiator protein A [Azospirillum oleiclasticum]NYZ16927.1 Replication protein A [Azospirillum oleiclasticum]NYZ21864.1 Replication protein A [Azospirillum oleiclasticum]